MIKRKQNRRRTAIFLAGAMMAGLLMQPLESSAASAVSSQAYTKSSTGDMEVSANIADKTSAPSYSILVPASLGMGALSSQKDNLQEYDITVKTSESKGTITVSTPENGTLTSGKNSLAFTNKFGTQSVSLSNGSVWTKKDSVMQTKLHGTIGITAEDTANAAAGNYTGTTTFTITHDEGSQTPDQSPDDPSPDPTPDPTPDPDPDPEPGQTLDPKELKDGVYSVYGDLVKVDKSTISMANDAINHTVKLTVKNGDYYLTLDFAGLEVGGKLGYLSEMKYFKSGYTTNQYGEPQGELAAGTVESVQLNSDGSKVSDDYGTDYPDLVTFEMIPEAAEDGYVPIQVVVSLMESVSPGLGVQSAYLRLDWTTLKTASDEDFDDDSQGGDNGNNGNDGNNGGGGNILPGGSSLGGSSLGSSTLPGGSSLSGTSALGGTSSLGGASSLAGASAVKTGDENQGMLVWALILAGSAGVVAASVLRVRYKQKIDR